MEELFYIQDKRTYHGNAIVWWGHDCNGYTSNIKKAGKYTKEYINNSVWREDERFWPCDYIDSLDEAHITIIDSQYVHNKFSQKLGKNVEK